MNLISSLVDCPAEASPNIENHVCWVDYITAVYNFKAEEEVSDAVSEDWLFAGL